MDLRDLKYLKRRDRLAIAGILLAVLFFVWLSCSH
jgi:hypothetical protein